MYFLRMTDKITKESYVFCRDNEPVRFHNAKIAARVAYAESKANPNIVVSVKQIR